MAVTRSVLSKQAEGIVPTGTTTTMTTTAFPPSPPTSLKKSYPKEFKPVGIPKYDGKQDPRQWIQCYSVAIEVSGGYPTPPKLSTFW
jgi:hypothetical protein